MGPRHDPFSGIDPADLDLDGLLSGLETFQRSIADSSQRLAVETADAWSDGDVVHVWVNAQGVVVQVDFDEDLLPTLTAAELGDAVVEATQAAAATMRTKVEAFQAGIWKQVSGLGVGSMADELKKLEPAVPLSAPDSPQRRAAAGAPDVPPTDGPDVGGWRLSVSDDR